MFSIFRHQALGVERRKDAVAEKVQEARDKKVVYKKKKMQIEELLTEREVLLRTMNLLPKNVEQLEQKIESFGVEPITVPSALPSSHAKIALPETTDVEELRSIVTDLVQDLDQRRDTVTELKKRRSDLQEVFNGEEETFDSKKAEYESRRAHLNEEFEELKPLIQSLEERQEEAEKTIPQVEEQINEAEKQLSAFNSAASNPDEDLKVQLEEEQAIAESLLQNNGSQITDYE
ncbi:unnamed protein product, partial [Cylicostephanus goldi]